MRLIRFLLEQSLVLVIGAAAGLAWANLEPASYRELLHLPLLENPYFGSAVPGGRVVDLHFLVNDVLMAFFFALAGKEVWEARLPGGALHDPRKAATPLCATLGGMAGPALIYTLGALALGRFAELGRGWAIPCATDIAFSYLVARRIFGARHPAIPFLLLLAIADDALGLIILALFYPQGDVQPVWLLLPVLAVACGLALRRLGCTSFWWYLAGPGALSWWGFEWAGLSPALGLLPIIPTLPHAHHELGRRMQDEPGRRDALSELHQTWRNPVELILGLFGLCNAGVQLGAAGPATGLVLAGLVLGKPLGITACGWLAAGPLGFGLPAGMSYRDLFTLGCAAGIGFTVALFVSIVAFPEGPIQDAAKMGALASLASGVVAVAAARALGVPKRVERPQPQRAM